MVESNPEAVVLVAERYRLVERRADSGMVQVYRAVDLRLDREVLVQLIPPEVRVGPGFEDRFHREARQAIGLTDPHIIAAHDYGIDPQAGPYLVMEYPRGQTLREWLASKGRLPPKATLRLLAHLFSALMQAHSRGIVHGGLTPDNILIDEKPGGGLYVRVLDFGLAGIVRAEELPERRIRTRGAVLGVPRYQAPEQLTGQPVDARSDVYSAAVVAFEALTGQLPHGGRKTLTDLCPEATPALQELLEQCLKPGPADRPPTAVEVYLRLQELGRASGMLLLPPGAMERLVAARKSVDEPEPVDSISDAQFSLYRPSRVVVARWYPLLVMAHRSNTAVLEEVARQARAVLGRQSKNFERVRPDDWHRVPRGSAITLEPDIPQAEVNPLRRTFLWKEEIHREEFRLRVPAGHEGPAVRGSVRVWLDSVLLADIALTIRVVPQDQSDPDPGPEIDRASPYRKIFVSYAHADRRIVDRVQCCVEALGDRFLRDVLELRSGQNWSKRLEEMIAEADIFQLFWSRRSMNSPFCRREWEYALSLGRANFVRPVFWGRLARDRRRNLPPPELEALHFSRLQGLSSGPGCFGLALALAAFGVAGLVLR